MGTLHRSEMYLQPSARHYIVGCELTSYDVHCLQGLNFASDGDDAAELSGEEHSEADFRCAG